MGHYRPKKQVMNRSSVGSVSLDRSTASCLHQWYKNYHIYGNILYCWFLVSENMA